MNSYYMPPEWHPHHACLLIYPHNTGVFRTDESISKEKCGPARLEVRNVARAICNIGKEDVIIFCNTESDAKGLLSALHDERGENDSQKHKIIVRVCASDDSWCRDTGPTFVFASNDKGALEIIGLDWRFNAYGGPEEGCYWPCLKDQAIAQNSISILNNDGFDIGYQYVDMILEGGSFHTDGEGTIITTEECLLNRNRNREMSKDMIESKILKYLGASKMIWLPFGLAFDDDTNGHVDNLACFARPGEVILSWTDNKIDSVNRKRFEEAERILMKEVDAKGRSLKVHKLHIPRPMYLTSEEVATLNASTENSQSQACERLMGERLAASYVNFYRSNNAIILPQFGDGTYDEKAIIKMREIFPDLNVVGVDSREILIGGGNIHCITQQLPLLME